MDELDPDELYHKTMKIAGLLWPTESSFNCYQWDLSERLAELENPEEIIESLRDYFDYQKEFDLCT